LFFLRAILGSAGGAGAGEVGDVNEFTPGGRARAAEVNENFNGLKGAVDDSDARISDHENRITEARVGPARVGRSTPLERV